MTTESAIAIIGNEKPCSTETYTEALKVLVREARGMMALNKLVAYGGVGMESENGVLHVFALGKADSVYARGDTIAAAAIEAAGKVANV